MEENYSVIEWTIENFTCWNYEIHGEKISVQNGNEFYSRRDENYLTLFPRGVTGKEKYLAVQIFNPWTSGDFELFYVSSDGSLLKAELKHINFGGSEIFIGPKFKTVVSRIREDEPFYKDKLTLRFRLNLDGFSFTRQANTCIDVFNTSLRLNSAVFKDHLLKFSGWDQISDIQYPTDEGKNDFLFYAKLYATDDEELESSGGRISLLRLFEKFREHLKVKFFLRLDGEKSQKTLAHITVSLNLSDKAILKKEMVEHIFTESETWRIPIYITMKGLANSSNLLLSFKIISGNVPKTYSHWSSFPNETEISFSNDTEIVTREISSNQKLNVLTSNHPETSTEVLGKELMCLYQDQEFCDLEIRCGGISIYVHRGILSARSPVLKRLLSSDMREASSGLMVIEDLDASTLTRFLGFLYSGTLVEDLQWDGARKLYYAADKYQVPTLKTACVSVLRATVSVSNVCEILSLADMHCDDQLTSAAHDFILKNYNRVLKSKEWLNFMKVDPILLLKTVTLFAQKDYVGKTNLS